MRLLVSEILEKVSAAKPADRARVLKENSDRNQLLQDVLRLNFDPAVKFDLPAGAPPYKINPQPAGLTDSNLYAECRRMYLLIKDHPRRPKNLKQLQVENVFIQILEGIHSSEAEMMIALKDKALAKKYKGVTESVVREAFPGLLPQKQAEQPAETP
jgi:hypothetical protein